MVIVASFSWDPGRIQCKDLVICLAQSVPGGGKFQVMFSCYSGLEHHGLSESIPQSYMGKNSCFSELPSGLNSSQVEDA